MDEGGPPVVPTDMDSGAVVVTPPAVHLSRAQLDDLVSAIDSVRDNGHRVSLPGSTKVLAVCHCRVTRDIYNLNDNFVYYLVR